MTDSDHPEIHDHKLKLSSVELVAFTIEYNRMDPLRRFGFESEDFNQTSGQNQDPLSFSKVEIRGEREFKTVCHECLKRGSNGAENAEIGQFYMTRARQLLKRKKTVRLRPV